MSEPKLSIEINKWWRQQKKRKEIEEKNREEEEYNKNQKLAESKGFCCHTHDVKMKKEKKENKDD